MTENARVSVVLPHRHDLQMPARRGSLDADRVARFESGLAELRAMRERS